MAYNIQIFVEAVDKASAVLQAIRASVAGLNQTTQEVAAATGGIGGAVGSSERVLQEFGQAVRGIGETLAPLTDSLGANAAKIGEFTAGMEASAAGLKTVDEAAAKSSVAVSQVAKALGDVQAQSAQGAAATEATARNVSGVADSLKDAGRESAPASTALSVINETLARLAEVTEKVVNTQALFAQSTARLTPLLVENAVAAQKLKTVQAEGEFSNLERALKRVGLSLKDVNSDVDQNASSFQRIRAVLAENVVLFGGLAAAIASVPASLVLITHGAIEAGDSLNDLSASTGLSVEFLSSMDLVTRQNGTNLQELTIGLKSLSRALIEAADPESEAAKNFRALGIDVRSLASDQKQLEAFLPRLADGFTTLSDGAGKLSIAQALLGRAGERLIPTFNQGAAGLAEIQQRARDLGLVLTSESAAAADRFNDKLSELGGVLRGLGNRIAEGVLPQFTAFVDLAVRHTEVIKLGFIGIAAAVSAIGVAIAGVKVAGLIDALLTAIAGPAALAKVASMAGLIAALKGGFLNLMAPLSAFQAGLGASFGAAVVARIGLVGVALASLTAIVYAGVEAWGLYKAKQQEALSAKNLGEQNIDLRSRTEALIAQFREQGKITDEEAAKLRKKIEDAFAAEIKVTTPVAAGFDGKLQVRTEIAPDENARNTALREVNRELRQSLDTQSGIKKAAVDTVLSVKSQLAVEESKLAILKAQKDLELAQVNAAFAAPASTVTVAQAVAQRRAILEAVNAAEQDFVRRRAELEASEARRIVETDLRFADIPNAEARRVATEAATADKIQQIRAASLAQLAQLAQEFGRRQVELDQELSDGQREALKRSTQFQLEEAQFRHDELKASELQFKLDMLEIGERFANLGTDNEALKLATIATRVTEKAQRDAGIRQAADRRTIELQEAVLQNQLGLAQNDPSPNLAATQARVNQLLREQNDLAVRRVALLREELATLNLAPDVRVSKEKEIQQLETEQIIRNRQINIQDPTNLPRLQSELGFQNQLDQFGNKTGERELIAPFRALDDFLTGTLQTTFSSLSASISGWITGTATWAQVWTQAGNQIFGMVVQLILEYTLFNQIRTVLDAVFHRGAQANIVATSAVGKAAQASQAATAATAGAATTAAYAPAAAATSIASFGFSATTGLVLALAAIAGIVAAFAFAQGGVVPATKRGASFGSAISQRRAGIFAGPGGPTDDSIITTAPAGTAILNAAAVQHYGGLTGVEDLASSVGGGPSARIGAGGSDQAQIRVSAGEAWLAPDVVARIGGSSVIDAINRRLLPRNFWRRSEEPAFASGGVLQALGSVSSTPRIRINPVALGTITIPAFERGGTVVAPNLGAQVTHINQSLQAELAKQPTVNVDSGPIHFASFNVRNALNDWARSTEGRKVVLEIVYDGRGELGVRA